MNQIMFMGFYLPLLEQRQYKNDSIQSKISPILKLARFFPHYIGGEKERQFQSWNYFRLNAMESFLYCLSSSKDIHFLILKLTFFLQVLFQI